MPSQPTQTVRLPSIDEIPEGEGREFKVGARYVAISQIEGAFYAMEDACPHADAPLNNGPVCDSTVTCLWHGWRFNIHDGACLTPAKGRDLPIYPIAVRGEDLYVTLLADDTTSD
jgi:nitrite reductase/ring-hydroxylating ferredoxin subunit